MNNLNKIFFALFVIAVGLIIAVIVTQK